MSDLIPPSGDEIALLRFLDAVDGETEAAKRDHVRTWEDNIKQVRGDQWRLRRQPYFLANIIKNQVRRKVSTLTEAKPEFKVQAVKPDVSKAATAVYNACKAVLDGAYFDDTLARLCQYGMAFGSGFVGISWDPLREDVDISFLDPRRVFLDPGIREASRLDRGQYIRIDTILPLSEVRRLFPVRGALVKPDSKYSSYSEGTGRSRTSVTSTVLAMLPRVYKPGLPNKPGPIPRAEIREYWIRDSKLNTEGAELFPGGRHIVRAGNIVLLDEPNPYWDGGWPIEMFEWDMDFDSPWGLDDVQDLRRLQESINRMGDAWIRNLLLGSNFKIVGDVDALDPDQWEKLDNEAGLIIRKKPQRQLDYVPAVPPDPNTPAAIEGLIRLCDMLTGNADARGSERSGASASAALEGLQMARQTLVRSVARRLESVIERLGQKLISRIFQYFTADRMLFIIGPEKDWIPYAFQRELILKRDDGSMRPAKERETMFRDFQFMVTPLSSLALTRVQRTMAALQLRSATGVAPSVRRILAESDMGDPDAMIKEGLEEAKTLPPPPPPRGRGGRS